MSQRKTQFGVEGQIQPTLHITWGIYRRIPDAGNTWRKEVLGAYPDAHTAQSCLRMLLIGRGYDIDAANQRAAAVMLEAQEQADRRMIEIGLKQRRNGHHAPPDEKGIE